MESRGADASIHRLRRTLPIVVLSMFSGVLLAACGGEETPELTFEDRLVELEGRSLTPAEVAERAEIGQTLCRLDDRILDEMWFQLSEDQLDFQDAVIVSLCPERAILYAEHTGRFVTEQAEDSGVRTSTTRPGSTTSRTPNTADTTTRPTTSSGAGSSTPTTEAPGDDSTTSSSTISTPPTSASSSLSSSTSTALPTSTSSRVTTSTTTTASGPTTS